MAAVNTPPVPVSPVPVSVAAIPPFSPVALRLLGIVSQENVALNDLAELIRIDPAMSVEMIRLANSPLFGAREITGILHAISMLGLNRIKSVVTTVAIRDFLAPARNSDVFALCWRHSLATAFLAEEMASRGRQHGDTAYTAGLLHEIGQLGLIAARPAAYDALLQECRSTGRSLPELELERFGIGHRGMGLRLIGAWKLPAHFRAAIDPRAPEDVLGTLVRTACRFSEMMGFGVAAPEEEFDPARLPALPAGMARSTEDFNELVAGVATKINTVECSLSMV